MIRLFGDFAAHSRHCGIELIYGLSSRRRKARVDRRQRREQCLVGLGGALILASFLAWAFGRQLPLGLAPLILAAIMLPKQLPEVLRLWREAEDKRALILDRFIFDREAKI